MRTQEYHGNCTTQTVECWSWMKTAPLCNIILLVLLYFCAVWHGYICSSLLLAMLTVSVWFWSLWEVKHEKCALELPRWKENHRQQHLSFCLAPQPVIAGHYFICMLLRSVLRSNWCDRSSVMFVVEMVRRILLMNWALENRSHLPDRFPTQVESGEFHPWQHWVNLFQTPSFNSKLILCIQNIT